MRDYFCKYCGIVYNQKVAPYKDKFNRTRTRRKYISKIKHCNGWLCFTCIEPYEKWHKEVYRQKQARRQKLLYWMRKSNGNQHILQKVS